MLRRIDLQSVDELAREILDLSRERPIVGVTNRPPASQPLIDVSSLAARVADVADVCVIATGDATWRLAELLPGKAGRLRRRRPDRSRHDRKAGAWNGVEVEVGDLVDY